MIFKKLNKILLSVSVIGMSGLLSSCIMDNYDSELLGEEGQPQILEKGTYYAILDINPLGGNVGTKADGTVFQDGTDEDLEHSIGSTHNYILFFDSNKKLKEVIDLLSTDDHDDPYCQKIKDLGIEARYAAKIEVEDDYQAPVYSLVVLNAGPYSETLESYKKALASENKAQHPDKTMDEILTLEWSNAENPTEIGRDGDYFTMSNSVYVLNGNVEVDGSRVPTGVIQKGSDNPDPQKAIHIHVERMVSKFSFDYADSNRHGPGEIFVPSGAHKNIILFKGTFDKDGMPEYIFDTYQWQAKITGWGMNAFERSSYLFKHLTAGATYYSNWAQTGWNDPDRFRSYWAEDPHYYAGEGVYPLQFRKSVDYSLNSYRDRYDNTGGVVTNTNTLVNFSYEDLVGADNWAKGFTYTPENTYDYKNIYTSLDNRADALAGTHLILCAELQTNISGKMETATIYRDRDRFFYTNERDVFIAHIAKLNYLLGSQLELKFKHYYWNTDNAIRYDGEELVANTKGTYGVFYRANPNVTGNDVELVACKEDAVTKNFMLLSDFKLDNGNYLSDATVKDGDGRMLINFDNLVIKEKNTNAEIKIYNLKVWEDAKEFNLNREKGVPERIPTPLRTADDDDIMSMVFEWLGPTGHFNGGRMYYYQAPKITEAVHGTVRNAWYKYYLKNVNSIGSPVSYPNNPIVPLDVENHDQMFDIKIDLIPWHTVLDADAKVLN